MAEPRRAYFRSMYDSTVICSQKVILKGGTGDYYNMWRIIEQLSTETDLNLSQCYCWCCSPALGQVVHTLSAELTSAK